MRISSTLRQCGWWCLFCLILLVKVSPATAHFVWVLLPEQGSREFAVVFSEGLHPDNPEYLAKIVEAPVVLHGLDGKRATVALKLREDRLIGQIPKDFEAIAIEVPVTWGVIARGGETFLLKYRALGVLDLQRFGHAKFDMSESAGPLLRLEAQGKSVRVRANVGTGPLPGATIKVIGGKDPLELQTTSQGLVAWTPNTKGEYGLYAKSSLTQVGQYGEQSYGEIRSYVTVSVRVDLEDSGTEISQPDGIQTTTMKAADIDASIPELPFGITSFGAARIGDSIYVYGGHTGTAHSYWNTSQSNQLLAWDTKQKEGSWKMIAEGKHRLQGLAMVPHGNRLILVGGFFATNEEGEPHQLFSQSQVVAFDTENKTWSSLPDLPSGRSSHDAIVMDDHLYVVGGWTMDGAGSTQWHDSALVLDLSNPESGWVALPGPQFQRRALALAAFDNKIFAIGGMDRSSGPTRNTSVYDPGTQQWAEGPELLGTQGMVGFGAAAWPVDGKLVVTAYDGSVQVLSSDQQSWIAAGSTEDARFFHRMLPFGEKRLVLVGGANMEIGKFTQPEVIRIEGSLELIAK